MRDRENQPFFPVFLYDEKMMDGSLTKGLFRGLLLLKAGLAPSPIITADKRIQCRHTDTFSSAEATQMGQSQRQRVEMPISTEWSQRNHCRSVTPQYR